MYIRDTNQGFLKQMNKQKLQLKRSGRLEGQVLMSWKASRPHQEEERLPAKESANEKPWTLCLYSFSSL